MFISNSLSPNLALEQVYWRDSPLPWTRAVTGDFDGNGSQDVAVLTGSDNGAREIDLLMSGIGGAFGTYQAGQQDKQMQDIIDLLK